MKKWTVWIIWLILPTLCLAQKVNGWTIMYYAVGSNSSETDLLSDIGEMIQGKTADGYEVITLIDRVEGYSEDSTTLGENFTDTRLYQLEADTYEELDGGQILPEINVHTLYEANMGDADLLKRFIQFCKANYPAKHYMLALRSHGNGASMCPDAEAGTADRLFPAELRDVLTQSESVDILGLDVCSMAGLENLYEWRPSDTAFSADYVIASAPLSGAWAYDQILGRLSQKGNGVSQGSSHFEGGMEKDLNPLEMTPREFASLIIEEVYDSQRWASWGLFDNSAIEAVKTSIDELARLLASEKKAHIMEIVEESINYYHNPGGDLETSQLAFPYYGEGFLPTAPDFQEGKHGAYLIFPLGDKVYSQTGRSFWSHITWFHSRDRGHFPNAYGFYDWCKDGGIEGNGKVENFFEYLDFLFDEENGSKGGVNDYRW